MSSIPWIEAYRPNNFDNVVLDPYNKKILQNIISTRHFPNLLFYGPPGTGKTTTIINLIDRYQETHHIKNKELMIHLNASDERGIEVIRNQIYQFVNSKNLFTKGLKFVILDEVDYMTKTAQQALRYLLQNYTSNVRFCLICNYISRMDEGLQHEFVKLRFNQLPKEEIFYFLRNISEKEKLNFTNDTLNEIQNLYKSDIRSMINFMQSNQDNIHNIKVINSGTWIDLYNKIICKTSIDELNEFIQQISIEYNIDKKNIINNFFLFLIRNNNDILNSNFLNFLENIIHTEECKSKYYVNYSLCRLLKLL
jgi:DNA polymerase III delta prime subunit